MAKSIKDLRQEKGYRSAREFADALGIATSSMSRYDRDPETIPLKHAWAMADLLDCSIDEVVGREQVTAGRNELQEFYDGLSREGKALFDEFKEFVAMKEERAKKSAQDADDKKYERLAMLYERMFTQAILNRMDPDDFVVFEQPWMMRDGIAALVEEKVEESRYKSAQRFAKKEIARMKSTGEYNEPIEDVTAEIGDPDYDMALEYYLVHVALDHDEAFEGSVREVTEKVMAAYDRMHPEEEHGSVFYSVLQMP